MKIACRTIGEEYNLTNVACIDMEGLDIGVKGFKESDLYFRIDTYAKLGISRDPEAWNFLNPVNYCLKTLSESDLKLLGRMFYDINIILKNEFIEIDQLIPITDQIMDLVYQTTSTIGLSEKIHNWVKVSNIHIPNLENIGNRPQDNKRTTFYLEDYLGLFAIIVYCKLFCPVFGQIIFKISKLVDNSVKETHCTAILKKVLDADFHDLTEKLLYYIQNVVAKGKAIELTSTANGYTLQRYSLSIYSSMLIKKFVNIDLYRDDGDIMVYIVTCSKHSLDSLNINLSTKNTIKERKGPDMFSSDAEGNVSRLETESYSSRSTVDVPIIIRLATERMINSVLSEYGLSKREFNRAVKYYNNNPVPITEVSKYITCTFFGHRLGGAKSMYFLHVGTFIKLIALLQLYLIKIQHHPSVIHLLSVVPTGIVKEEISLVDRQIQMNRGGSGYAYNNCKRMFPYAIGNISWDTKTKSIINFITNNIHHYNTAPNYWDLMNIPNANQKPYTYEEPIIRHIYTFIWHTLEMVGQRDREDIL
jgi:hypothetical protein